MGGNVGRMEKKMHAEFLWEIFKGKRPYGRLKHRWEHIKMQGWIYLDDDRNQWGIFVKTFEH